MPNKKKPTNPEAGFGSSADPVAPILKEWHYAIDYTHSYAQDSPFYAGLSKGKLMGSACKACSKIYATPRGACMDCGTSTQWVELPTDGKIHTFTTCFYGGETFLKETPFTLILVEFNKVDTLFLSRLINKNNLEIKIGMHVKAEFLKNPRFLATDVYFIPGD